MKSRFGSSGTGEVKGSKLVRGTGYLRNFRGFPRPVQANAGTVLQLGEDHFLQNTFHFIIHYRFAIRCYKVRSKYYSTCVRRQLPYSLLYERCKYPRRNIFPPPKNMALLSYFST